MVFNVIIFICVIVVLIRHVKDTAARLKQSVEKKTIIRLMFSISGIMFLFGLTWLFALLTFSSPVLREVGITLFTIFNSLQGLFIFIFFCIVNEEARKSWKEFFSHGRVIGKYFHSSSKSSEANDKKNFTNNTSASDVSTLKGDVSNR